MRCSSRSSPAVPSRVDRRLTSYLELGKGTLMEESTAGETRCAWLVRHLHAAQSWKRRPTLNSKASSTLQASRPELQRHFG